MGSPAVSFIVSTFNRPSALRVVLASLAEQTFKNIEVIVMDASTDTLKAQQTREITKGMQYTYVRAQGCSWPESANQGAKRAKGEYLCFPSDDAYYPPNWLLRTIHVRTDLILSNMHMDALDSGWYHFYDAIPKLGEVLKSGFLVRKACFPGFFTGSEAHAVADALLVEKLVADGVQWGKPEGKIFWIQNS